MQTSSGVAFVFVVPKLPVVSTASPIGVSMLNPAMKKPCKHHLHYFHRKGNSRASSPSPTKRDKLKVKPVDISILLAVKESLRLELQWPRPYAWVTLDSPGVDEDECTSRDVVASYAAVLSHYPCIHR